MYLTILIPCLNEENTIGECIDGAREFINESEIDAEILVVDNGSSDKSALIAGTHGAAVIKENKRGYGSALITGIAEASGEYIIFGDADCSYDFRYGLAPFITKFKAGYEYVNGNRFAGKVNKKAIGFVHRNGVRFLSFLGRHRFKVKITDFHCGLRGFKKDIFGADDFVTSGMEFATEIIAVAAGKNCKITEVPVTLYPDKRGHRSHLRIIRDGFRHLRYIISRR